MTRAWQISWGDHETKCYYWLVEYMNILFRKDKFGVDFEYFLKYIYFLFYKLSRGHLNFFHISTTCMPITPSYFHPCYKVVFIRDKSNFLIFPLLVIKVPQWGVVCWHYTKLDKPSTEPPQNSLWIFRLDSYWDKLNKRFLNFMVHGPSTLL